MRTLLNAHPQVAVPPESRFITELWSGTREVDTAHFLSSLGAHKRFAVWELPLEAVAAELPAGERIDYAAAIEAAYRAYARAHDKRMWGDKTPRYVENIDFLAGLFPHSRFVHIVRDGRNVALSYSSVPFGPQTVAKTASLWARRVGAGVRSGRALQPGRYLEVRYEDLVEDPADETKALCDFLDLEWDAGMLETERAREFVLDRAARYNPRV
ncbi:MAG: sulfotransferase family protein, partial [Actinomycetota bacterium]